MDRELIEHVKKSEGFRTAAYQDTEGVWTIGYGTNLQTLEIDAELAEKWLMLRLEGALRALRGYSWFPKLNKARQNVVIDMVYNLGMTRFHGFQKFRAALAEGDFARAKKEMLDSKWAGQVKGRAIWLADVMEGGVWPQ